MFFANFFRKKVQVRNSVAVPIGRHTADFVSFRNFQDGKEHIALVFAGTGTAAPLVRIHSECLTGDVFHSGRCDCGEQLNEAIDKIAAEGGVLLYLRQEGRGIGLYNKLDAYELQLQGFDTYEANQRLGLSDDLRDYNVAADMLKALDITSIRLLSNNPDKRNQLLSLGIQVASMLSTGVFTKPTNESYLRAKVVKTGHKIRMALA